MRKIQLLLFVICLPAFLQAQSLYGDMETWRTITVDTNHLQAPGHWCTYDSLVFSVGHTLFPNVHFVRQSFQTTDAHSGNYAAKIITRQQDTLGVAPGVLVNAFPKFDILKYSPSDPYAAVYYTGGTAVTVRPTSVTAWIKYLPKGSDVGEVLVQVLTTVAGKDSVIGTGDEIVPASPAYSDLVVSISYIATALPPQKMIVTFFSSSGSAATTDSSTMYVDDVTASYLAVPTVEPGNIVTCYPNPGSGQVNLTGPAGKKLQWILYNISGQPVVNATFNAQSKLDLSYLPGGMYLFDVLDETGVIVQRGKLGIR